MSINIYQKLFSKIYALQCKYIKKKINIMIVFDKRVPEYKNKNYIIGADCCFYYDA